MPLNVGIHVPRTVLDVPRAGARRRPARGALDAADRGKVLDIQGPAVCARLRRWTPDVRPEYVKLLHACNVVDADTVFLIDGTGTS